MSVRIENLRVEAFRGIGAPLYFDFSSPLTLIYAPNGTGKTTLCEAAEWLLTGQVERLSKGNEFDRALLNSKFMSSPSFPVVEAEVGFENGVEYVRREINQSAEVLQVKLSNGSSALISDHQWLKTLATGVEQSSAGLSTSSSIMRQWIKGSRFLTIEALAALVDSDEDNAEKRLQVFSDILGVRHLLEAEKLFAGHASALNEKLEVLQRDVIALENEKNSLRDFEQGSISGALVPSGGVGIDSKLNSIEGLLGVSTDNSLTYSPTALRIEKAESAYGKSKRNYERRSSSFDKLSNYVSEQESNEERLRVIDKTLIKFSSKYKLSEERCQKKHKNLQVLDGQVKVNEELLRKFIDIKMDLDARSKELSAELERHSEILKIPSGIGFKLSRLRSFLNHNGMSGYPSDEDSELRELHSKSNSLKYLKSELNKLESERKHLQSSLLDESKVRELEEKVSELDVEIEKLSADFDVMARPLERLRSSVNSYLSHSHFGSAEADCPVCGHEWDSLESMLSAITSTIDEFPLFMKKRKAQCDFLSSKKSAIQGEINFAKNQRSKFEIVEVDLKLNQYRLEILTSELKLHGISSRDPLISLQREAARMRLRSRYTELLNSISLFENYFPGEEKLLSVPLAGFSKAISALLSGVQRKLEKNVETARESIVRERHELNGMRAQQSVERQELKEVQNKYDFLRRRISDFQVLWGEVGDGLEWNMANFKKAHAEIILLHGRLISIGSALDEVRQEFKSLASAHRIGELDKEIRILSHKLSRAKVERDLASRAQDDFKTAYSKTTSERMSELSGVVNPLFSRMHSNRVYDEIQFGSKNDKLFLTASSAGSQFNPDRDFSQGQRQDLALAIFIARARSIGGTFFLDEPVMHLDDLNRVGLLDIFRSSALEGSKRFNLVVTTSSKALARHIIQKFSSIKSVESSSGLVPPLKVYGLEGNARSGVAATQLYPL
ncbi:AAA family ATPase [Pseudomonas huaxiensis]|uniref:AAA family ATPase n=1 Tax=Pseudomonas huaxiensis TaxID=2213017 RepID=UPI00130083ED|nr:AAA family ATPase [Pseudomonas huaxiensis]